VVYAVYSRGREDGEGQSAVEVRQQLELHLARCRTCQVIYDSTCKTVKIVTETGSFDLPQNV
jgi:hypothetical protein